MTGQHRPDFGATLGATRVTPSRDDVARALKSAHDDWDWRKAMGESRTEYEAMADTILALLDSQPTVAEVRKEAEDAAWERIEWERSQCERKLANLRDLHRDAEARLRDKIDLLALVGDLVQQAHFKRRKTVPIAHVLAVADERLRALREAEGGAS